MISHRLSRWWRFCKASHRDPEETQKRKLHSGHRLKPQITQIVILVSGFWFLVFSIGCEAFVRKFTRKPKKENLPRQEMVLVPEEYKSPQMPKEELYRQYFLFWKSWQDELIGSLSAQANHKKQIDCIAQAISNLMNLRTLLNTQRQKQLDVYIGQLNELKESIIQDSYGSNIAGNRQKAERIKRSILQDFSYNKVNSHI